MPRSCIILFVFIFPFLQKGNEVLQQYKHAAFKQLPIPHYYELKTDTPYCAIPFTRAGNLIVIKAKVDSLEGNFIIDTGAPGLVLNLTYFRDYPITGDSGAEQSGITGTSSTVMKTTAGNVSFGTFSFAKTDADLANLGHIENTKGIKILGLLGLEFFKECEMIIDYESNIIHLEHITKKTEPVFTNAMLKDQSAYSIVPFDIMDNRIITTTELGGKKLKMIIDCAAESNILNSKLPNKLMESVTITKRVKLTGSGSKQVEALYGAVSNMKIGGTEISALPVLITNLENTCFSYNGCIDGVLGFDFLSLHKIGFNFVKHKMYIWK